MKYQLKDRDITLIKYIEDKFAIDYEIDRDGYIEIDNLLNIISDLRDNYDKIENKFIEYDEKINEDYHEHFINEQIDRGMHPHEYE